MDPSDMPQASVTCLYSIVDLPKLCERQKDHVTVSADTKKYLLYLTVRKLGPILAKKLLKKCTYMVTNDRRILFIQHPMSQNECCCYSG